MQRKRYAGVIAAVFSVFCLALLAGCGETEGLRTDITNLQIDQTGLVTHVMVSDFDKDYYSVQKLQTMIQSEIAEYNEKFHHGEILLESAALSETDSGKVMVQMQFSDYSVYSDFNEAQLFYGTVAEAKEQGYELDVISFTSAENPEKKVTLSEITQTDGNHILITNQNMQFNLPYKVLYTTDDVEVKGSRTVMVQKPDGEAEAGEWQAESWTYVITK